MSDVEVVAAEPAPEQVATAAPETAVVETPEAEVTPKSFSQEELDAAISKRLAREQRKWAREQAMQAAQAVPQQPLEVPPMEQFESPDAYAEALAYKRAHELIQQREMQRMQVETLSAYHEREEVATERYADWTVAPVGIDVHNATIKGELDLEGCVVGGWHIAHGAGSGTGGSSTRLLALPLSGNGGSSARLLALPSKQHWWPCLILF
jgi:hypothetical protein